MQERPLTLDDVEALTALRNAVQRADRLPMLMPAEDVTHELTEEGVDLARDSVGVWDRDELIAWAIVMPKPTPSPQAHFVTLQLEVDPAHRRRGVGGRLLADMTERGRERLTRLDPDGPPRVLRAFTHEHQDPGERMARDRGWVIGRYYEELTCTLEDRPTIRPRPHDVSIARWDTDRDEDARRVKNLAFADHWGSNPSSAVEWRRFLDNSHTRHDLSVHATDADGELIGIVLTSVFPEDWPQIGRREAWIDLIATARAARGRGVAGAMVDEVLRLVAADELGLTHASLGVDTANPTGAYGLYARLGFSRTARTTMWMRSPLGDPLPT